MTDASAATPLPGPLPEPLPGPLPEPPPRRRRGWTRLLLVASLVLNLFLVGLLAGGRLAHGPIGGFNPAAGPGFVPHLVRSLPPAARDLAQERFADRRTEIRRQVVELRRQHRAIYRALTAERFDRAALEAALAEMRGQVADLQASIHRAMVEVADQLDAEDRRQMAETLRRLAGGHGRGRGPGQGREPPPY